MSDPCRQSLAYAQGAVNDAGRLLKRVPDSSGLVDRLRQISKEIGARLDGMPLQEALNLKGEEPPKPLPLEPPEEIAEAAHLWLDYKRTERKETYKEIGLRELYREMVRLGPERALAAVRFSISCRYQGLIEPKNGSGHAGNGKPPDARRAAGAHEKEQRIVNYSRYEGGKT